MKKVTVAIQAGAMVRTDVFLAEAADMSLNTVELRGVKQAPGLVLGEGAARASVTRHNVVWTVIEEMAE